MPFVPRPRPSIFGAASVRMSFSICVAVWAKADVARRRSETIRIIRVYPERSEGSGSHPRSAHGHQILRFAQDKLETMSGPITTFIKHHYRHFNAAALVSAAEDYVKHLDAGGKMLVTMAGAMSTAEIGLSLAEMIRRDK